MFVCVRSKVKKTFSRFVFNVKAWGSEMGSKIKKTLVLSAFNGQKCIITSEYHAKNMWTNQIEEPWKLTNHIDSHLELSLSCVFVRWFFPIRFFRIGSSVNQVIFYWESNQSGNFTIRLSFSQAFQVGNSVNPGLCACEISHSGFFLAERTANQLSWAWDVRQFGFLTGRRQAIRFFQTEKLVSQVISKPSRYETKNHLQAKQRIWWLISGKVVRFEIRELHTAATSRKWHSGGAPTND